MKAREFLEALFGASAAPHCVALMHGKYALKEDGKRGLSELRFSYDKQASQAAILASANSRAGRDVYFGLCTVPPGLPSANTRTKETDATRVVATWLDVDFGQDGHKGNVCFADASAALDWIQGLPTPPSIIVHSGGGYHCYWPLIDPLQITDDATRSAAKELTSRWNYYLIDLAKSIGVDVDHTGDLARVLRVPGTKNRKIEGESREVDYHIG